MGDELLRSIYYDIENPASFSSAERLYEEAKRHDREIKLEQVKKFLSGELSYTLHRRVVRKIKRNPIVSNHHLEEGQADLVDIQRYKAKNKGYGYILTVIDTFSRKAYATLVQTKDAKSMTSAFEAIFKEYKPCKLQTDEGKEFTNMAVQRLFKRYMIKWFVAKNERIKCAMVERFQRTLMTRIHKYFTSQGTNALHDVLQTFVSTYNNTPHKTIKMAPNDAVRQPESKVFRNIYGFEDERAMLKHMFAKPKLPQGQSVRIPTQKNAFEKGYTTNFTDQVYSIDKPITGIKRPVYRLKDHKGQLIKGNFYPEEVQAIDKKDIYRVVVLAERKRGRGKQYLVHYVNHPSSEDEWISGSKLQSLS